MLRTMGAEESQEQNQNGDAKKDKFEEKDLQENDESTAHENGKIHDQLSGESRQSGELRNRKAKKTSIKNNKMEVRKGKSANGPKVLFKVTKAKKFNLLDAIAKRSLPKWAVCLIFFCVVLVLTVGTRYYRLTEPPHIW